MEEDGEEKEGNEEKKTELKSSSTTNAPTLELDARSTNVAVIAESTPVAGTGSRNTNQMAKTGKQAEDIGGEVEKRSQKVSDDFLYKEFALKRGKAIGLTDRESEAFNYHAEASEITAALLKVGKFLFSLPPQ